MRCSGLKGLANKGWAKFWEARAVFAAMEKPRFGGSDVRESLGSRQRVRRAQLGPDQKLPEQEMKYHRDFVVRARLCHG